MNKEQLRRNREFILVSTALKACQPQTRRQLSDSTGLEIATLCRILYHAVYKQARIEISHYAPCTTTGIQVMYFKLTNIGKGVK